MALQEDPQATWDKRFKSRHYSYRDFHTAVTGLDPTAAAATYVFGTNARAISRWNWPALNDFSTILEAARLPCYAREVMIQCTEDCWIIITSINPVYIRLIEVDYTPAQIAALGVPMLITEVAEFIPRNAMITFHPTYGYAITFYYLLGGSSGTIRLWIEGNVEGGE